MLKLLLALGHSLAAIVLAVPVARPGACAAEPSAAAPSPQSPPAAAAAAPSPQARRPRPRRRAKLPPAGSPPAGPVHPDHVPDAGRRLGRRAADVPLLHPDAGQPAVRRRVGAVRREDRGQPARGLQAAVGDQLPRRPLHRSHRCPLRQRRHGQAHHLQDGRAPAGEDRRLHRQQEAGSDQDRGEAQGREHPHPARLVHRSGPDPEGRKRRPQLHGVQGLPVRRGDPRAQADAERTQAGQPDVQRRGRPEGQDQEDRVRGQQGHVRRRPGGRDEAQQGRALAVVHHQPGRLPGSDVRGGRRPHPGVLPRQGLHQRACRPARDQDPAGREGRQDAQRRAEGARHRRRSVSRRQPRFRGQQGREDRRPAPAVQAEGGRLLQREADPQGHGSVARAVRQRRVLGVHRLSGPQAPQHARPGARPTTRRQSPRPRSSRPSSTSR